MAALTILAVAATTAIATTSASASSTDGQVDTISASVNRAQRYEDQGAPNTTPVAAEISASLPKRARDGVRLHIGFAGDVTVGLPGAATADVGRPANNGTVVYTHAARSAALAAQTVPGGVRVLVAIDAADAPTEYAFPISLPDGVPLQSSGDGGYFAMLPNGQILTVEAPWARDATGKDVPTSYRVEGQTLIQTVAHTGFTYPVVADPEFTGTPYSWTIWFNRAETATIAGGGWGATGLAAVCLAAGGPVAGTACLAGAGSIVYTAGVANNSTPKKCVAFRGAVGTYWPITYTGCRCTGGCSGSGGW